MRISDWSSDVCSSDLKTYTLTRGSYVLSERDQVENRSDAAWQGHVYRQLQRVPPVISSSGFNNPERYSFAGAAWYSPDEKFEKRKFDQLAKEPLNRKEIGRASCRERVCQYVSITVVAVSLKTKAKTHKK